MIVAPSRDSARDLELQRGATISGTVRYDDGSPANEVQISVLRMGGDGKASELSLNIRSHMRSAEGLPSEDSEANDVGHYRVSGLPAGKYIVKTTFPVQGASFYGMFGGSMGGSFRLAYAATLSVYSGNVFREKDAKPIEVIAGSDRDDVDITIPLLGLHTVSGSVSALADGHAIRIGFVRLLYSDDKSEACSTHLSVDGSFDLRFVPEGGIYILRIDEAADWNGESVRDQRGFTYPVQGSIYDYASFDLPLSVHSDLSNVNINLPDKPADESSATAQKQ